MRDKTVIITGANSGIGKAAAVRFAEEGYTVVMACRNLQKGDKARQEIIQATSNDGIDLLELDISSFRSIQRFCSAFKGKYEKLDVLIHNAAYFSHGEKTYQLSKDNIELSFATNTVGPFLMTQLLVDMLKKSHDARVLNACTTNIRHYFDPKRKIDFDNLRGELKDSKPYNVYKMYGDSKMAMLIWTFKMAEELKDAGIKINAVQIPAIKMSKDTMKKFKSIWRMAAVIQSAFGASQETMANTYFHICTSPQFAEITGKLVNDKRELVQPSHYGAGLIQDIKQLLDKSVYPKYVDDPVISQKVWTVCKDLTDPFLHTD